MFGSKKTITDRAKDMVTDYVDTKFEDYRGQISLDLARGLASLAGLIALWTLAIVCLMFVSISIALLLGWIFSFWMNTFAFVLSFLLIAVGLLGAAFYILINKEKYIEEPVFKIMAETLRSPETWKPSKKDKKNIPVDFDKDPKTTTSATTEKSKESPKNNTSPEQ